ncbi:flagellar brake protein [Caldalkalibacillus mannanilyticus]|uniref:flagellar brake protein n=1 Tax=Caldalkalibacillus mannanilyticus TaxID=1418 RepID=UPI000468781A|nr:flagellar brake domain-containing protein [Caldalkalibacillus mannanilyticus]
MKFPYKIGELLYMHQRLITQEDSPIFKARIADLSEEYILIEMPMAEGTSKYGFFLEGSEFDVWFYAKDGSKYQFVSTVLGRKKDPMPVTLLTHPNPDSILRSQRREFIRVPCFEDLAVHPVNREEFPPFLAKVLDVSGGGLAFQLFEKPTLKEGDHFKWWLSLPLKTGNILHPSGTGRLIRIIEPHENGYPYKCSVQFKELTEVERQKIMRFCFEKQLEIKRKES